MIAGECVGGDQHLAGANAGQFGGIGIIADGIDVAAEGGVVQHVPQHDIEHDHRHDAEGDDRAAQLEADAEDVEPRGRGGHIGLAHRLVGRIDQTYGHDDVPGAQRHDERRQAKPGNEEAVGETAEPCDREARDQGQDRGHAVADHHVAHDDEGQHHHDADGKVDAGGQHDECLCRREDTHDRDLLHDERQRVGREELLALRDAEEEDEADQNDQRNHRGVGMKEVLEPLQPAAPFLESGDGRRASGQNLSRIPVAGPCRSPRCQFPCRLRAAACAKGGREAALRHLPKGIMQGPGPLHNHSLGLSPSKAPCPWRRRSTGRLRQACR